MRDPRSIARYDKVKRSLDVAGASVALIVTLPLQAVVALLVRSNLGSPVLFRQERPGRDGKLFTLIKFRSMIDDAAGGGPTTDVQRLTRFGALLRATSIDELPTLMNVIKGDMSFVGPRPLLVQYLDRYTQAEARRHDVRPGITGLAQVSGRNSITWAEKFHLDTEYVDSRSFALDASIVLRTITTVFGRKGISEAGQTTVREFMGHDAEGQAK